MHKVFFFQNVKQSFLGRVRGELSKTRKKINDSISRMGFGKKIDVDLFEELEEILVSADMSISTVMELMENVRKKLKRDNLKDIEILKLTLIQGIREILEKTLHFPIKMKKPHIIMIVGVNGVGKTTTVGKLAYYFEIKKKKRVLLAAGDTFRAAAKEQLVVWAERIPCDIVSQKSGADPSSVVWDAVEASKARNKDVVIIDTAGRLHTKIKFMEELKKMRRILSKREEGSPHETFLVLDANIGQNAIYQAKTFNEFVPISGLILTKLDGTAKGGSVVSIVKELGIPLRFIGFGENIDDLEVFDPVEFSEALF